MSVYVNLKTEKSGSELKFADVESDYEFGPLWQHESDAVLTEIMHRAPVYALTIALVSRIHELEEYTGGRHYKGIEQAMRDYYFSTHSRPTKAKRL